MVAPSVPCTILSPIAAASLSFRPIVIPEASAIRIDVPADAPNTNAFADKRCTTGTIGANCTILPAVNIGAHAMIGAGTVVVREVRERTVVVGNPGRETGTIDNLTCPPGFFERPYVWEPYTDSSES